MQLKEIEIFANVEFHGFFVSDEPYLSSFRMSVPSSNCFRLLGRKKESCYSIKNG